MSELEALPGQICAGTTIVYRRQLADYPAGEWTLKLLIRGKSTLDVTAAADGTDHVLTLSAAATATLSAGRHEWAEQVSRELSGDPPPIEAYLVGRGQVEVDPDFTSATAGQLQSHEERLLALIEAEIERFYAGGAIEGYSLTGAAGGSMVNRPSIELLERRRDQLKARVNARRRGNPFQNVALRFAPRRSRA